MMDTTGGQDWWTGHRGFHVGSHGISLLSCNGFHLQLHLCLKCKIGLGLGLLVCDRVRVRVRLHLRLKCQKEVMVAVGVSGRYSSSSSAARGGPRLQPGVIRRYACSQPMVTIGF